MKRLALLLLAFPAAAQDLVHTVWMDGPESGDRFGSHMASNGVLVAATTDRGEVSLIQPANGRVLDVFTPIPGSLNSLERIDVAMFANQIAYGDGDLQEVVVFKKNGDTLLHEQRIGATQFGSEIALGGDILLTGAPGYINSVHRGEVEFIDVVTGVPIVVEAPDDTNLFGERVATDGVTAIVVGRNMNTDEWIFHQYGTDGQLLRRLPWFPPRVEPVRVAVGDGVIALAQGGPGGTVQLYDYVGNWIGQLPTSGTLGQLDLRGGRLLVSGKGRAKVYDLPTQALISNTAGPLDLPDVSFNGFGRGAGVLCDDRIVIAAAETTVNGFPLNDVQVGALFVGQLGPNLGTTYCTGQPNSTGALGQLAIHGVGDADNGSCNLTASSLPPGEATLFVNAPVAGFLPGAGGSAGTLCLGASIGRHMSQIHVSGDGGQVIVPVDLESLPQPGGAHDVLPGETWHFQAWHRDGATSNFTGGVSVTFQ